MAVDIAISVDEWTVDVGVQLDVLVCFIDKALLLRVLLGDLHEVGSLGRVVGVIVVIITITSKIHPKVNRKLLVTMLLPVSIHEGEISRIIGSDLDETD